MKRLVRLDNMDFEVTLTRGSEDAAMQVADKVSIPVSRIRTGANRFAVRAGDRETEMRIAVKGEDVFVAAFGRTFHLQICDPVDQAHEAAEAGDLTATAPMPGIVVEAHVAPGVAVVEGQNLMTIESMKLLTVLKAAGDGIVETVHFQPGEAFNKGAALVTITQIREDGHA